MYKIDENVIKSFCRGIIHGSQYLAFFGDLGIYWSLISEWKRGGDRNISLDGYSGRFYGKKSGLRREGKGLFEYVISLEKGLKKLYLNFKPRIEGMSYWDKIGGEEKEWKINEKQGEGVEVYIQSSYHEPREIKDLILDTFRYFDIERFYESWNKDETYLITFEDHIRYDEKKERDVVGIIEEIRTLIGLTNEGKWRDVGDRIKEGYRFRETVTNRWDKLGFENKGYYFLIKSYRLKKFPDVKDPILKNPKLEIGLDPKLNRGMRIRWNEADWLIDIEDSILENVAIWSGLTTDDLIEDEMFKIRSNHIEVKEWEPKELKRYYMEKVKEVYPEVFDNRTKRRFIYLLCDKGVLDTKELMDELGLKRAQVFRLIDYFEKKEIIKRIPSSRTVIEFVNPILEKHFKEKIKLTNNLASFEKKGVNGDNWKKIPVHPDTYKKLKRIKEEKGITWDDLIMLMVGWV